VSQAYIDYFIEEPSRKDNAGNFTEYINNIFQMIRFGTIDKSVLYSEYIVSGNNLVTNSGLMFEIENQVGYDDNAGKFEKYYRYPIYGIIICHLFVQGIRYDENTPWRFGLDFNLDPMKKKLGSLSVQQYLDLNFELAEGTEKEMKLLFQNIFFSYLKLLETNPLYHKNVQKSFNCFKTYNEYQTRYTRLLNRKIYSENDFERYYKDNFSYLIFEYAKMLNVFFDRKRNMNEFFMDLTNKTKKGLDKEALVRYTFNKMKYC
jgi:hypothetical protein